MEKSDFDRLLERYLTGQVSEQERIKLEAWLDVMKTETLTNFELSRKDEDKLMEKIMRNTDNLSEVIAFRPARKNKNKWVLRMAAGLLIISLISYGGWYLSRNASVSPGTISQHGVRKMILNDGSLAWLRGDSKLIYYEKSAEGLRYAELQGEALFEVAKDASHPFVIACGKVTAKVLGTSFSLKTGNQGVELKVLTGKVNLSSTTDKAGVVVEPNEQVVYSGNGKIEKSALSNHDVAVITGSTEYDMHFSNTRMEEVLNRIGKKFEVSITVGNKQLNRCRITADFTDHSLESTLNMLSELLELDYKIVRKTVQISGKGCN